ncbi:MAG: acetoin utilization protein AcuC [Sedimenticola sp.]|nr:acetoin utilization protein AcuC [Sedimenticola sp.]
MYLYAGEALARYGFGNDHPLGPDRFVAFWQAFLKSGLGSRVTVMEPVAGRQEDALLFHTRDHVDRVRDLSARGSGMLDPDTPVFPGVYEAALVVVGTVLDAVRQIMDGATDRAFVPIAGLHHASRAASAGFCVFNDCAIAIEALRLRHRVRRVLYVDIDAHHADGVFYGFEDDPDLAFVDVHEDGRYLYPGTGAAGETGTGPAEGRKLNIPLPPGANDDLFFHHWPQIESYLEKQQPEFIILQCGADSIAGDPLTHMQFSNQVHRHVATYLRSYAEVHCQGRILALGGGGYNRSHIASAWVETLSALCGS